MKVYFVHQGKSPMVTCIMVFENGWVPFQELCDPKEAIDKLWALHPDRQKIVAQMGIMVEYEPVVTHINELPQTIYENTKRASKWQHLSDLYLNLEYPE
jgi:hypothetical protein